MKHEEFLGVKRVKCTQDLKMSETNDIRFIEGKTYDVLDTYSGNNEEDGCEETVASLINENGNVHTVTDWLDHFEIADSGIWEVTYDDSAYKPHSYEAMQILKAYKVTVKGETLQDAMSEFAKQYKKNSFYFNFKQVK